MSATTKSGLLFGIISFFTNLGVGVLMAICTPLCGIVWGAGAGLLSIVWADRQSEIESPGKSGAIAGGIAGIGAILGLFIGTIIQFTVLGGQEMASQVSEQFYEQFGLPYTAANVTSLWQWSGLLFMSCCLSLVNILIMAGAGAAAAYIYASSRGDGQPAM